MAEFGTSQQAEGVGEADAGIGRRERTPPPAPPRERRGTPRREE